MTARRIIEPEGPLWKLIICINAVRLISDRMLAEGSDGRTALDLIADEMELAIEEAGAWFEAAAKAGPRAVT